MTATTKEFTNVTWFHDRYSDGTFRAYAWSTVSGDVIAEANGVTEAEAYSRLHRQLCGWSKSSFDSTLVSKNGDNLRSSGIDNRR